jgi:hypothetical protein
MRRARLDAAITDHRLPQPATPGLQPQAFFLCPLGGLPLGGAGQWLMMQQLYQMAFAQAQAVVRPSLPERDLLAVWN